MESVNWLVANQDASGLWGTDKRTPYRDATVAVEALNRAGGSGSAIDNGITAIMATSTTSTDYLARKVIALTAGGTAPSYLVDSLAHTQNDDGGWGYRKGYGSNSLETALALKALWLASDSVTAAMSAGVSHLLSRQNVNGGWGFGSGDSSRVFFTAQAIDALALLAGHFAVGPQMQNGVNWLITQAHPDGGFGTGAVSNPYETGLALSAIAVVDTGAPAAINARNYLETTQLPNGSWNDDAYSTAMALYGIVSQSGLQGRRISLDAGMNLLGLPVDPADSLTASDLLSQNPGLTEVRGWNRTGQSWVTGDFPIAVQDGFFARTSASASLGILGRVLPENQCTALQSGLNLISVPNENACYTAYSLMDDVGGCTEAHHWDGVTQKWVSVVKTGPSTVLGSDFSVSSGYGYFVRVNASGPWCTQACDTITIPELPDLYLTADDIMLDPNPVAQGSPVFIGARFHNIGTDTAFTPRLDIYHGDPSSGGQLRGSGLIPENIPPGGATQYFWGAEFTFTETGFAEIYAIADYPNLIQELDETNNKAHRTLQVTAVAGLSPTASGGEFAPLPSQREAMTAGLVDGTSFGPYRPETRAGQTRLAAGVSAAPATVISAVHVGTVTSSSVTITWVTDAYTDGCVNYGTAAVSEYSRCDYSYFSQLHLVELTNLQEATTYLFEVVSGGVTGNNGGAYYSFTTTHAGAGAPAVLYGRVQKPDFSPAADVIVSATLYHSTAASHALVVRTAYDGVWLLNLGDLKNPITNDVLPYSSGDSITISVQGGSDGIGRATRLVSTSPQDAGVITLADCDCPQQGDVAPALEGGGFGDGFIDVFDVIGVIGIAFSEWPDIQDPQCPTTRGDVNNDGVVDVFDVIYIIATAFSEGPNPVNPCGP